MERMMSVEDKIKRAEEIYYRRRNGEKSENYLKSKKNEKKKDIKLLKKMFIQILVCLAIYSSYYLIQGNGSLFSQDVMNKTKEILSYDVNFKDLYQNLKSKLQYITIPKEDQNIGGASQEDFREEKQTEEKKEDEKEQKEERKKEDETSQMENDSQEIKKEISFIKPVEGTVSSRFGKRNPSALTVPKNHTGLDIAAETGTKIKSATDGKVELVSSKGDYGNHLKVQNGDVTILYAHCNKIYVKEGDKVKQGQEIGEVGSTGNSTGPHLHFEIRKQNRVVNPQMILEI